MNVKKLLAAVVLVLTPVIALPASAQEMRPFTHDLGTTDIPVQPRRIVALHDVGLTIPLIELGVTPIASGGRVRDDGAVFMRGALSLIKTDFDTSGIQFVDREDFEAIAALEPDLIVTNSEDAEQLERYALIAPAIVLNRYNRTPVEHLRVLADATGALPAFEALAKRLESRLDFLRAAVPDAASISVSMIHFSSDDPGNVLAPFAPTYGALGHVLTEAGFDMPDLVQAAGEETAVSVERIGELDADFMIGIYVSEAGETPGLVRANMDAAIPGWCQHLHACRTDQYIWLPLDEAFTVSFSAMDLMVMALTAGIAGRRHEAFER